MLFPNFEFRPRLSKLWICICGALVSLSAVDLGARDWFRYETANFEVYSEGMRYEAKQLTHDLELVHQVATGVVGERQMANRKTRVIIFAKERSVISLAPNEIVAEPNAAGVVYDPIWMAAVIRRSYRISEVERLPIPDTFGDMKRWNRQTGELLRESNVARVQGGREIVTMRAFSLYQEDASQIVMSWDTELAYARKRAFKSYVQLLLREGGLAKAPWFSEGMAEMLGNMEVERDLYVFGITDPDVVRLMLAINYIMPLGEFLAVDAESFAGQNEYARLAFVAQSWALMHYCYLSDIRGEKWRTAIWELLADSDLGSRNYGELIRKHLGIEPEALERELHAYTRRVDHNGYRSPLPAGWPSKDISFKKMSEEEMMPHLEEIGVRLTRSPETVARLKGAVANGAASDREVYLAGVDRWLAGDRDAAIEIWTRLSNQFEKSSLVIRAPAQQFLDSWLADPDLNLELSAEESAGFRIQLKKALEKDPSDQLTMMYLAWLEALSISPDVANVNLIQRSVGGLVHPELTLLAIAKIRMDLGDFETARALVYEYHDREHWDWENLVDLMEEATDLWSHVQRE